jgi:hypothetical protein
MNESYAFIVKRSMRASTDYNIYFIQSVHDASGFPPLAEGILLFR